MQNAVRQDAAVHRKVGLSRGCPLMHPVKIPAGMSCSGVEDDPVAVANPLHGCQVAVALDGLPQVVDAVINVMLSGRVAGLVEETLVNLWVESLADTVETM